MRKPILLLTSFALLCFMACKHEKPGPVDPYGNFPEAVGKIFVTKCANSGCHNDKSYTGSGDIRLDRWEYLFSGIDNSSPVVPYSPDYSTLLYAINTDSTLGIVDMKTRMPKAAPPLSQEEYLTIRDWIAAGAPDKDGNVPFASEPDTRQKIYITQQGCDLVAVVDAKTKTVMRYIQVGTEEGRTEAPHNVKFTADGRYAYVCFSNGNSLQKIDAATDKVVGTIPLSNGSSSTSFNVLCISPDGKEVLVSDWVQNGSVLLVDAVNMRVAKRYNGIMINPHGVAASRNFDTFFVTGQSGNIVYKLTKDGDTTMISLNGEKPTSKSIKYVTPDPHDLVMAPDYSKYFVTCENTGEVIVVDAHNDKVLARIHVGNFAQELAVSYKLNKVFVTCMEEPSNLPRDIVGRYKGTVAVIDIATYNKETITAKFSQPHGIAVDDINGYLYVASRNTTGIQPHHPSACAGNNGYYQVFELNSSYTPYTGADRRYETSVQPYSADVRFKKAY